MSKNWKEILADKSLYPDDMVISLKDGTTMNLGSMREYDRENEGRLTAQLTSREQELSRKQQLVSAAEQNVLDLFNKYLETTGLSADEALAGKTPTNKALAAATETGSAKEVAELKDALNTLKGQFNEMREKQIKPVVTTYLNDYYEMKFDNVRSRLPKKAQESVSYEKVLQHAEKQGFKDKAGRYDIEKAARDMTRDFEQEEWREAERARLKKEVEAEQFAASLPKPGSHRPGAVTKDFKDDKGRTISIEESLNRAFEDTDLWAGLAKQ